METPPKTDLYDLVFDMHGDLKVVKEKLESAAKSRKQLYTKLELMEERMVENKQAIERQGREITRVKAVWGTVSSILALIWTGLAGWIAWFRSS